jgi:diaminohydroxyphosphoribosylaminopyrimidine deaminase/5-amino-6-(5-phosphoribosylamino)uracil reductase
LTTKVAAPADERFMRRAIALAERALGETNPNPAVGCLLVRDGRVVGEGFHARAGGPHAEAGALAMAGPKAKGATAYVTLEPCVPNPGKRTPACAPRLIEAGVRRVVIGVRDFNPKVGGAGMKLLRSAGLDASEGICGREAARLAQSFNTAMRHERPFIALKAGLTLDGRTATATGESKWITSRAQRASARALRRLFDGVLVGVGTALLDDPMLLPVPRTRRPFARVVLDSQLRLPLTSRLVKSAGRNPLYVVCTTAGEARRRKFEERGVIVVAVDASSRRASIADVLRALFARGLLSLLVEGGSEVMGSFVRERTFDEVILYRAPLILGGRGSLAVVGGTNPRSLIESVRLRRASGEDSATLRYGLAEPGALDVEVYERVPNRTSAGGRRN